MREYDVVIIGGGPAGMAAAIGAKEAGAGQILILERDSFLGGILNQCIHNGFGLHMFKEELTGPEYAHRYIRQVEDLQIPYKLNTIVLNISPEMEITAVSPADGLQTFRAKAIVLAMGCRERPRGAINIQGARCAGIYTAGAAQKFVNINGYMPGKEVVVLGSGDIGLIMARRMTLEGATVHAVVELAPYSGGLKRNIVQCLDDYGIPLLYSHTVTHIAGKERVEAVTISAVDQSLRPVPGTERVIPCDALLLSVGLLPENELSREAGVKLSNITGGPVVADSLQTNVEGVFACGNVLHVHDLVDYVSEESHQAGRNAARYAKGLRFTGGGIPVIAGAGIRYTVPTTIAPSQLESDAVIRFRVDNIYREKSVAVYFDNKQVRSLRKRILAPGEMETLRLPHSLFEENPGCRQITICLEDPHPIPKKERQEG